MNKTQGDQGEVMTRVRFDAVEHAIQNYFLGFDNLITRKKIREALKPTADGTTPTQRVAALAEQSLRGDTWRYPWDRVIEAILEVERDWPKGES